MFICRVFGSISTSPQKRSVLEVLLFPKRKFRSCPQGLLVPEKPNMMYFDHISLLLGIDGYGSLKIKFA